MSAKRQRSSQTATIAIQALPIAQPQVGANAAITNEASSMLTSAMRFARRLTAPSRSQTRIIGPNTTCLYSHACRRCEPREAKNEASNTKGTVGKPGTKIPMMPNPNASNAKLNHSQRKAPSFGMLGSSAPGIGSRGTRTPSSGG